MKVVCIGSGNLATHLAKALHEAKHDILQVYSRTLENASQLAYCVHSEATNKIENIRADADFYIFSVKDDALSTILSQMPHKNGIWVHTAGSVSMDVFLPYTVNSGAFYPLQTFSKQRDIDFSTIPIFIEAQTTETCRKIELLAKDISQNVRYLQSEKRKYVHLAAVFACNFTNHLYVLASEIIEKENLSFDVLKPLIIETAAKIEHTTPIEAQTGPAVRFDKIIIQKQLDLIANDELLKEIYSLLSKSIHKHSK